MADLSKAAHDRSGMLLSATLSLLPSSLRRSLLCSRHLSPSVAEVHSLRAMGLGHTQQARQKAKCMQQRAGVCMRQGGGVEQGWIVWCEGRGGWWGRQGSGG